MPFRTRPLALLFIVPCLLQAQDPSSPPAATSLFHMIGQGGWAMWPLGLLMLALFYFIFLCWRQTQVTRFVPHPALSDLSRALHRHEFAAAAANAARHDTVLTRLLGHALTKARPDCRDANREAMDTAFIEAAEGEENAVAQSINYLNVIATVAPMVGLLGTVSGMIGAFQKIGEGGMGKPDELAGKIGEALITTAAGLIIGIPAMIFYFYYRNRLTTRMLEVGQKGGALFDEIRVEGVPIPLTEADAE